VVFHSLLSSHLDALSLFQKNAQSPLSLMFDNKSALEEMHFTLLTRIMRHNGLSNLLDSRPCFRTLLRQAIMATDMRVHDNFMTNFKTALCNLSHTSRDARRKVLAEGIIKCADISNPVCSAPPKLFEVTDVPILDPTPSCLQILGHCTCEGVDKSTPL
jgi:hypothetical protein